LSLDWEEERCIVTKLSDAYLMGRSIPATQESLEQRSEELVGEKWSIIEEIASALLAKEWEPRKPLKSGDQWSKRSKQDTAKYVPGEEVVILLQGCGLSARCISEC